MRSDIDPNNAGYELNGSWAGVQFDPSGRPVYDGTTIMREPTPDEKNFLYYLNPNNLTVPTAPPSGGNFPVNTDWRVYIGKSLQAVTVNIQVFCRLFGNICRRIVRW